jgi:hypothetical protein
MPSTPAVGTVTITRHHDRWRRRGSPASWPSGVNGIIVSAGASDIVTLRLRINGAEGTPSGGGLNGIRYLSGAALHVETATFWFTGDG